MATQAILWTALPNRYTADGTSLRVSVLVSPRLDPQASAQTLKTFPDFVDWPATLSRSTFTIAFGANAVTIDGGDDAGPNRVDTSVGAADSATWKALFPATTFVRGFEFRDLSKNTVLSYDAGAVDVLVRSLYTELARNAGDGLPRVSDFLEDLGWNQLIGVVGENDLGSFDRKRGLRDPRKQFEAIRRQREAVRELGLAENLARFQLFHTPPATPKPVEHARRDDPRIKARWLEYERAELPSKTAFAKEIDFHQIVAAMNQYPALLRRLGLVVDFAIEPSAFAAAPDALLTLSVALPAPAAAVKRLEDASPRTRALLTPSRFEPLPRPTPEPGDFLVANGLLKVDPHQFRLVQTDVDGAGLKITNFARSLARMRPAEERLDPTTLFEREVGAPALRNAGLMLVHRNRAAMLKKTFDRNLARNEAAEKLQAGAVATPPELFAEDVVRGYRVDIWDGTTLVWRSLCRRVAGYDLAGGKVTFTVPDEEGTVRLAATTSADPASNQDVVYLHEVLTSWTGWSLWARQPGKAIDKDDKAAPADAEVPPGLRLETTFEPVAGSLPRLRYGRRYWIRVRVVDLAGNSLDPQGPDFGPEQPRKNAVPYFRYEPIAAPAVALVRDVGPVEKPAEGESMHRLAIRSFNVAPADNTVPTGQTARRFAVPARTTVKEAEQHGMLDAGGKVDPTTFAMLKASDHALKAVELDTSGPLADPTTPTKTTYAVFDAAAELPYLPDPLALRIGARIFDLPGWSDVDLIEIPLYPAGAEWPHARPFTVQIVDDPAGSPRFVDAERTLLIPLPKGTRATLRLSVLPTREALGLMGVWQWLSAADRQKLRAMARRGRHWMLTPWRTLELVHAVQKPLIAPELELRVQRDFGQTSASPNFVASVSLTSTDRVDLCADWNEPADDAAKKLGENRARSDTAFSVKITDEKSYASRASNPAFTGIPEHEIVGPDKIRAGGFFHDLVQAKLHEFHDTRYRRIEYRLEATTRFREYMPTSVLTENVGGTPEPTDEKIKVVGKRVTSWIPSSAPPPAPEVLYAVPTFGWVRTREDGRQASWRRGSGLRVYLQRPWNVSGYGEMLAVALAPASFGGDPNEQPAGSPLKNFVTQWGNDPTWASPFVSGTGPRRADFPLARTAPDPTGAWLPAFAPATESEQPDGGFAVTGLAHPALPSFASQGRVDVAPHDVFYDDERELWYCDIEVAAGRSYYPFIRLALARYQPVSVDGAHLSNIVLADFMSLAPDRWVNVTQTRDQRVRRVGVFGATYSDSAGHHEAERSPAMSLKNRDGSVTTLVPAAVSPSSVVEVWVERLDPALGEDFGWARDPGALVQADAVSSPRIGVKAATVARQRTRARRLLEDRRFEELASADLIGRIRVTPTLWQGSVTLAMPPSPERRYRLVVAEYEEHLVDDARPYDPVPTKKDRRLVFVEHLELD